MKNSLFAITLFIIALFTSCQDTNQQSTSVRTNLNMNTDWAFYRGDIPDGEKMDLNDADWIASTLPHIMQLEKKHCGGDIIYDGIGWYRRYFKLPAQYKNKRVVVSFEGVMTSCEVFLNEKKIKIHHGGYVGFVCDLTDEINWGGNNLLAVRVSAEYDSLTPPGKPQGKMDFYYYSGIYRDVEMVITDKLHITDALEEDEVAGGGVFVTYPEVTKERAQVYVKTHIKNAKEKEEKGNLRISLTDQNNNIVVEKNRPFSLTAHSKNHFDTEIEVNNPALWHPYTPNMYNLKTEVVVDGQVIDVLRTPIGIRTIKYTTEEGFFINGEKLYMREIGRAHV